MRKFEWDKVDTYFLSGTALERSGHMQEMSSMVNENPEIGFLLPLAGLGIAAAAAAATLVDRAIYQRWWWERLSPQAPQPTGQVQIRVKKSVEPDHPLVFPHTEEEEHSRVFPHFRIKEPEEGPSYPLTPYYPAVRTEHRYSISPSSHR